MSTESLHVKYRPQTFDEVYGHGQVLSSLKKVIKRRTSHTFLFSGPSGSGKTTLARICAHSLGCEDSDIIEIDGATNARMEDMRAVQNTLRYVPLGNQSVIAVIVDEAQAVSKKAFQSMLKVVEEPPDYAYWFFCTTEPGRIPRTIKTRCVSYNLKDLTNDELKSLVDRVIGEEGIKVSDAVKSLVIKSANGSPRQALVNLSLCSGVVDRKKASALLRTAIESEDVIELARFIVRGGSWVKAMSIVAKLQEAGMEPESIRIVIVNYVSAVLKNAKSDKEVVRYLATLEAFESEYNQSEGLAPLLLSIGRTQFGSG